jgi:hypothetical protein
VYVSFTRVDTAGQPTEEETSEFEVALAELGPRLTSFSS